MAHTRNIGEGIKKRRAQLGLTQEQLAEASGVHRITIAKYETQNNGMTLESAIKLARALDCTIDDLMVGNGEDHDA